MKLEIGKWYEDRLGDKVLIVGKSDDPEYPFVGKSERDGVESRYKEDGSFYANPYSIYTLVHELGPRRFRDCKFGDRLVWLKDGTPCKFIAYVPELKCPLIVLVQGDSFPTHLSEDGRMGGGDVEIGFPEGGETP